MFNAKSYSQKYAVTFTLHPKVRRFSAEEQYEKYAHQVVSQYVSTVFPGCKMSLVAELTKSYDLHFHGIIQFNMSQLRANCNVPRWFREKFRNHPVIGFVCLKAMTEDSIWIEYISKALKEFKDDLNLNPVITDDYNLFDKYKLISTF